MVAEFNLVIGLLGVLFGAGGLAVGVYSYRKQKEFEQKQQKFEEQLERKEELRSLAVALEELRDDLDFWCLLIERPREYEDLDHGLYNLERDILSYHHTTKEAPKVHITNITAGDFTDGVQLSSVNETMEYLKDTNESVLIRLEIGDNQPPDLTLSSFYLIWDAISRSYLPFHRIREILGEYEELLQQFDRNLLEDAETASDTLLRNLLDQVFEKKEGKEFDPTEFGNTHEIGDEIYRYFLYYEGVHEDIEQIHELIERINNLRSDLLQTSYS